MSNSCSSGSDNEEKKVKKICCKACGKKFSYHQGLYTHKKSGVCRKTFDDMINVNKYIDNFSVDINNIIDCDDINKVFKYVFKQNDYNKLPFRIYDKKRKLIRILIEDDKYVNDKDYYQFERFLNKVRYIIMRHIDKNKMATMDDSTSKELIFLNTMLGDFDVKIVIGFVLSATTDEKPSDIKVDDTPLFDDDYDCENDENN